VQGSVWELCCSLSICLNLFWFGGGACFAYDKTVINQRRVEKSAVEDQSEENSVWIRKWTTLLGIFCKLCFTLAVTSCYQVHALNADAHLSAALLCYLGATGAETSLLLNCILHWIVLTISTLHTRNSTGSCITLLWLQHNHKMSISYHKNGWVCSHQSVGTVVGNHRAAARCRSVRSSLPGRIIVQVKCFETFL